MQLPMRHYDAITNTIMFFVSILICDENEFPSHKKEMWVTLDLDTLETYHVIFAFYERSHPQLVDEIFT